ncbi:hypothetical protein HRG_000555 [Hirsutella rhossiliensis]|uniref:Uncharacterized protein n=1 Tax=Hirsutella rhossiliensis TaxID=111463 RepID=A0A9P8N3X2_9HYPO|nr:uncharacterized protein HRG_00555 [Hirsutella rhossiliensis]KAH0967913.1 hypothetical protein HRG_00555 [Hirsutella rhossiliensis]
MSDPERVPYEDALTEGQGFNTFLQSGCMHDAVEIKGKPDSSKGSNDVEIIYNAQKITSYEKLVEALEIGASVGVSKMQTTGKAEFKFLDRREFETSFLTYLVKVDIRQQPSATSQYSFKWTAPANPNETYGNRFISGFVRGGALFARVSIVTEDSTHKRDIEQSATAAFSMYGVDVNVTQSMKSNLEQIQKHSKVHIYLHYVGAPPTNQAQTSGKEDDLLQLKSTADSFLADAKNHQWKRFALLEKYTNISDWKGQFTPLNYVGAADRSWSVFIDFTKYRATQKMIQDTDQDHYKGGKATMEKLNERASDALEGYRNWITGVSIDPEKAKQKPGYDSPERFRQEVLLAIQTKRFIAQKLSLDNGRQTHIIDDHLHPQATKLFELEAYQYGDVIGTSNVLFGKKDDDGIDKYICLMGRNVTPGYIEQSRFWVSEKAIEGVFEQKVSVVALPGLGCIQLELEDSGSQATKHFDFYVKKV